MTPWWTDQQAGLYGGFAGAAVGILGGIMGTLCGICAPAGKCRGLIFGLTYFMIGLGIVGLLVGLIALALHQPFAVCYPLLLLGVICTFVSGGLIPMIRRRYREADLRRLEAEELRRSS